MEPGNKGGCFHFSCKMHGSLTAGFPSMAWDDAEEEQTLQSHKCVLTAKDPLRGFSTGVYPCSQLTL